MIYKSNRPWIAQQVWRDVLFLHWPISYEILQTQIPAPFKIDTYHGKPWISFVLFQALHTRPRGLPIVLSQRDLLQLNIRTYVQLDGVPGVYFLSINTNSKWTVRGARTIFSLPYRKAKMNVEQDSSGLLFKSVATNKLTGISSFQVRFSPTTRKVDHDPESLAHFLTERYYLWTIKNQKILKGTISHYPWDLVYADAQFNMSGMPAFLANENLNGQPIAHYSKAKQAYMHPFERVAILNQTE